MQEKEGEKIQTFYVPKSIYDATLSEIEKKSRRTSHEHFYDTNCHETRYNKFSFPVPILNNGNILEAAHQALEDRNFRVLYQIIKKGLDCNRNDLRAQLNEYLQLAIEQDPKVTNKKETLFNFFKGLNPDVSDKEIEKMIKNKNKLKKRSTRDTLSLEDDSSSTEE